METIDMDWKTTKLKSLAKLFKPFNRDWAPLRFVSMLLKMLTIWTAYYIWSIKESKSPNKFEVINFAWYFFFVFLCSF